MHLPCQIRMIFCTLLLCIAYPVSGADDTVAKVAALMRTKEYTKAEAFVSKAPASPERSFMLGLIALRQNRADEALRHLKGVEQSLPLIADYTALYQAEALLKLGKHQEASAMTASLEKHYPASILLRQARKLNADSLYQSGNLTAAATAYQTFVDTYPGGGDTVEALFAAAGCKEATGDTKGALSIYRLLWLNHPQSVQASRADERRRELEKNGSHSRPYTAEELLKRADILYNSSSYSKALQTLELISREHLPSHTLFQIDLKSGKAEYRLRNRKQAEKLFARAAATSPLPALTAEARYWQAQALERLGQDEQAYAIYAELAAEGKKHDYVDDSIMASAAMRKEQGRFKEAIALYDRISREYPHSSFLTRARWESGWSRYLGGNFAAAGDTFKALLNDDGNREKSLYWLARSLDQQGKDVEAAAWYATLLKEYAAGFYATWYREQRHIKDDREPLGERSGVSSLPVLPGFEKPRFLAALGLAEEARSEMRGIRKKMDEKKGLVPAIARAYLEIEEYGAAISLFNKHRPPRYDKQSMPFWSAGYPLVYAGLVSHHATHNGLSTGLVYGLMRAESAFNPSVKSPAGALGLMQLMPATAKMTAKEKGKFNPQKLLEPEYNIMLGTRHFKDLLKSYDGDALYSIAAYNAGSGAVDRWRNNFKNLKKDEFIESIPYQETRDYVKKVYASAATYRQLYGLK